MEMLAGLTPFLYKTLAAMITTELLVVTLKAKKKSQKKEQDKATAQIKSFNEAKNMTGNDGLVITDNITLKEKFDFENVGIFAPTGAGKTTKYFYPNLLNENLRGSIVVIDTSNELYRDTAKFQADVCHRKVIRFSPGNLNSSEQYNLLEQCDDSTEVCQLASSLLMNGSLSLELSTGKKANGVEWLQMSESLLAAALLYVKDMKEPYNTIENAVKLIISCEPQKLEFLLSTSENEAVRTQYSIFKTVTAAANTTGSIKVTLASNMKLFTDYKLNLTTAATTFTAEQLRKEPTALYIQFPERLSNYLSPFLAPFFTQIINKVLDNYNYKSQPITFLMDEFANIGMIKDMQIHTATCRKRDMSFSLCLQSLSQLIQVYGRDNAHTIINNLKTKIILSGLSDSESLGYFEDLAGKTMIYSLTENTDKEGKTSYSYNTTVRNTMNKDEIRRMDDSQCLVIMGNKQPIIDYNTPYFLKKELTQRIKEPMLDILKLPNQIKVKSFTEYINDLYIEKSATFKKEFSKKIKLEDKAEKIINDIFGGKE